MDRHIEGIIFDMDGTLLDTLGDVEHCANLVLGRHGFPPMPREFYGARIHEGDENLVKQVLAHFGETDGLVGKVLAEMRAEYERHCDVFTRPFDRVPDLLRSVRDLGLRTAVLSNKEDGLVKKLAEKMFPRTRFYGAVGITRMEERKPNPVNALRIASVFGCPPAAVVLLGDSRIDMMTAEAAGMVPAGALWGYGSAEELAESGAEVLVRTPLDLIPLLNGTRRGIG